MSIIKVENLEKRFGDNIILHDVSCEIERGDIVSIIGPSGSGKSTFLRAINFLSPPTAGEVYFDGERVDKKNVNEVRRKMSMVFQNFGLFSHLTALQNLCAGPMKLLGKTKEQAEEKAYELLKTVGLTERANHYPHELSGGQKQRVAIARCLAMEPEVILFDEPTSALDPTMVGEVMAVIRNLSKTGLTLLIVTHEMSFAREVSSRVFYMDEGGIYESGAPEEIFSAPQKPKTQEFIYRIRSFNYDVASVDFDSFELLSGIDAFCFSHAVDGALAKKLRLIAEELVINIVVPKFKKCSLTVSFSDKIGRYEVTVAYPGSIENALDTAEDDLAAMMIRGTATQVEHKYEDEINTLKLSL
ncbi:MAG: ATP-binding cassette domain-containing protein [Oscillospiraceae bacterium]|jgi:polar amino acid transport system ATP-binding protein|nr:ATP-binding cassette domain-containing protein [Oscillospiraceae bacterium]